MMIKGVPATLMKLSICSSLVSLIIIIATTRKVAISPIAIVMPKNNDRRLGRDLPSFLIMTIPLWIRKNGTISIARKIRINMKNATVLTYASEEINRQSSVETRARKRR